MAMPGRERILPPGREAPQSPAAEVPRHSTWKRQGRALPIYPSPAPPGDRKDAAARTPAKPSAYSCAAPARNPAGLLAGNEGTGLKAGVPRPSPGTSATDFRQRAINERLLLVAGTLQHHRRFDPKAIHRSIRTARCLSNAAVNGLLVPDHRPTEPALAAMQPAYPTASARPAQILDQLRAVIVRFIVLANGLSRQASRSRAEDLGRLKTLAPSAKSLLLDIKISLELGVDRN